MIFINLKGNDKSIQNNYLTISDKYLIINIYFLLYLIFFTIFVEIKKGRFFDTTIKSKPRGIDDMSF